jgi:DNA-binding MarR family transcriptional regulator
MRDKKVLYQIKTLEKMVMRSFFKNTEEKMCSNKFKPTPTQIQIIEYILEHIDEEIYQNSLEDVLKLRRATVSGVLITMEKNGLIKRVVDKNDIRRKKIILNEKAKEIFENKKIKLQKIEEIIKKDIPEDELETFFDVIDKMKINIEQL